MNHERIRVKREKELWDELWTLIDGNMVDYVMNEAKMDGAKNVIQMIHKGQSLSISQSLSPDLFQLCEDVKTSLSFKEAVDFYIVNSPEINAYAVSRESEEGNHTIALNSGLIERFNNDELKFVIGHEIGHLISGATRLSEIVNFVFPGDRAMPLAFANKYRLWNNLSELTADRYGFIASPDIGTVASAFFSMASGLSVASFSFSPEAYMVEVEKTLEYFTSSPYSILGSHPINPVRIKAIQVFSESKLYKSTLKKRGKLVDDDALSTETNDLITVLLSLFDSEVDLHVANFLAASGIIVASADEVITDDEINTIVDTLSHYSIFPKHYLDTIVETEDMNALLEESAAAILEKAPEYARMIVHYLMVIVLADKECKEAELAQILNIAETYLNVSAKETVRIIGDVIRDVHVPRMFIS